MIISARHAPFRKFSAQKNYIKTRPDGSFPNLMLRMSIQIVIEPDQKTLIGPPRGGLSAQVISRMSAPIMRVLFCAAAQQKPVVLGLRTLPKTHESHRADDTVQSADKEQATMLDITAAAKPPTVTTRHLAYALAEQHQFSKKQSLEIMEALVSMITKHLKKGERVKIAGLGILQVRNRAARVGRNPATGEPINIKASKKVAFRASKELKMAI
jgi:DNA-binding protein HU-beta